MMNDRDWTKVERTSRESRRPSFPQGRGSHFGDGESEDSLAETEVYVDEEQRWRRASEVFDDHPGLRHTREKAGDSPRKSSGRKSYDCESDRRSFAARKSYADREDESDMRRSLASRKSYGVRVEEGDRRSFAARKSYADREDESDMRRSLASRKSYDVRDEEGDIRRSISSNRKSYDLGRDEEGDRRSFAARKSYADREDESDMRRSLASRKSYDVRVEEGDVRRFSNRGREEGDLGRSSLRKSYEEGPRLSRKSVDEGRLSRAERRSRMEGAEQRMLSQPPEDSESDILVQEGFRRKSEVVAPKPRPTLTLQLDADSAEEMKSIVWKFTERGAVVKVINNNCPEAEPEGLRAGDLLTFINEECVLEQPKPFIQKTWKEQQLEDRYVTLRFRAMDEA